MSCRSDKKTNLKPANETEPSPIKENILSQWRIVTDREVTTEKEEKENEQ